MFLILFLIGAVGFVAMALLSAGRMSGHGQSHGASHSQIGHGHAGHGGVHHAPSLKGPIKLASAKMAPSKLGSAKLAKSGDARSGGESSAMMRLAAALSPLDLFIYCLGFGATGMLVKGFLPAYAVWLAVAGALILNFAVIKPLMGVLIRWQSTPSEGLEGSVAEEAEAVSAFDHSGKGLVRLTLDGQIVQLLATLESSEHHRGVVVSKGDKVVILEVDAARNQCRVSRDLVFA